MINKIAYWYLLTYLVLTIAVYSLSAAGIALHEYSKTSHLTWLVVSFILLVGVFYKYRWSFRVGFVFYGFRIMEFPLAVFKSQEVVKSLSVVTWIALLLALVSMLRLAYVTSKDKDPVVKSF